MNWDGDDNDIADGTVRKIRADLGRAFTACVTREKCAACDDCGT
jgi:hypothetical protein